jgi:hypothetical protein
VIRGRIALSPCGTWRYLLERDFGAGDGTLNFILLNPSTADAVRNDPTIARCAGYARRWGYRRMLVTNVFALRATDPATLRRALDPVGPENDRYIARTARRADRIVCGWGIHGALNGREAQVLALLRSAAPGPLEHLGLTKAGQPRHPLYLRGDATPQALPRSR